VKLEIKIDNLTVKDSKTNGSDFTIQQNFFVKCENGTVFWVQNVYHCTINASGLFVSQSAWIFSANPGTDSGEVHHASFATPAWSDTNVGQPPVSLELNSYLSGSTLMMSGKQAGSASPVADFGNNATIVDTPADAQVQQCPNLASANTRPQHILAGYGDYSKAEWGEPTSGSAESYDAFSLNATGHPQWVKDNAGTIMTDQTQTTGETSHSLDWTWNPARNRAEFEFKNCSYETGIAFCYAPSTRSIPDFENDWYDVVGYPISGPDWQDITEASVVRNLKTVEFSLTVNDEFPSMETFRDGAIMILIDVDENGEVLPSHGWIDFYEGNLDYGIFIPSPEWGDPPIFIEDLQNPGAYDTEGATFSIEGNMINVEVKLNHIGMPDEVIDYVAAIRTGFTEVPIEDRVPNQGFIFVGPEKMLSDINCDGIVDILDITIVAIAYGSEPGSLKWNSLADLADPYDVIDILDITRVAIDYGKTI
jgi:hypothetical protein